MSKKQSQSGSIHLVIFMVLIIALIGALGFIYYQNFMQPEKNDTTNLTTTDTKDAVVLLDKSITENVTGDNLTLDYPNNWILTSQTSLNPDQGISNEKIFITSPDTNIKITFWSGVSGIGGFCDPETNGTLSSVKTYSMPNYSGRTLYETVTSDLVFGAGVLTNNDAIQVGSSACEKGLGFFNSSNRSTNQLGIVFKNNLPPADSIDSINSARATDNYKTAVKIVQLLHEQ